MEKICLIIHSLRIGGMERVMSQLANNFSKRENTKVDLILIGKKQNIEYPIVDSITIHRPAFPFRDERRNIDTLRTMRFLRRSVKEISPDSILSFGEFWNNLVLLSLYGLDYPVFISDRSQPDKNLGVFHNFLRNRLYPRATGYIAQTAEAQKVCLSKRWNNNVRVIGNPIRTIQSNGQVQKENIILTVGRLIKTKHFDQLIEMFVEIDKPDWKLVIVGGDDKKMNLSKELNKLIQELDAQNQVFLEGEQKDIDSYYRRSKIFAFTSSSEGFPNVIGEALAAGLPVISYDCVAGPSDMIQDGENGYLVDLFDRDAFKEKLEKLINDEEERDKISKNATDIIKKRAPDIVSDHFYSFITEGV